MKRKINLHASSSVRAKKRAMALPVSLIALLVAGMLVGVSMYLVENMATVSRMKSDDELRSNAALAGLERGKRWIVNSILVDEHIPRRENHGQLVTSADMAGSLDSNPIFAFLVARDRNNQVGILSGDVEGATFQSIVYDIAYDVASGVEFAPEMPLSMKLPSGLTPLEGGSIVQRQSYASSNRGSAGGGLVEVEAEYGFYVIRSRAVFNGIEKIIEQGVRMRE